MDVLAGFDLPDWTAPETGRSVADNYCTSSAEIDPGFPVMCTRKQDHGGSHAAGDGERLLAIWDES